MRRAGGRRVLRARARASRSTPAPLRAPGSRASTRSFSLGVGLGVLSAVASRCALARRRPRPGQPGRGPARQRRYSSIRSCCRCCPVRSRACSWWSRRAPDWWPWDWAASGYADLIPGRPGGLTRAGGRRGALTYPMGDEGSCPSTRAAGRAGAVAGGAGRRPPAPMATRAATCSSISRCISAPTRVSRCRPSSRWTRRSRRGREGRRADAAWRSSPPRSDLGAVGALWQRPQAYARFLGLELWLSYKGRLVVVMPNGVGLQLAGHSPTPCSRALKGLAPRRRGRAGQPRRRQRSAAWPALLASPWPRRERAGAGRGRQPQCPCSVGRFRRAQRGHDGRHRGCGPRPARRRGLGRASAARRPGRQARSTRSRHLGRRHRCRRVQRRRRRGPTPAVCSACAGAGRARWLCSRCVGTVVVVGASGRTGALSERLPGQQSQPRSRAPDCRARRRTSRSPTSSAGRSRCAPSAARSSSSPSTTPSARRSAR